MDAVELTFKYTRDEYVKAERQYLFASKTITKTSIVVLCVYFPLSLFSIFFSSFGALSVVALAVALFALIGGCFLYFYMPAYKFKQTSKYHEEYNLAFAKDGIKFSTPTINSKLKWDVYSELWESGDFYFLIQAPGMYTLIPKRAFANEGERQTFEEIATSNIKSAKRVL